MALPTLEECAEKLPPPCRFGRRYDARQRLKAVVALDRLWRDTSAALGKPPVDVRVHEIDWLDAIDDVADALGLFMSPKTRDEHPFDVDLWSRRRFSWQPR